ncbi:MAG: TIGR04255 family protein [Candidatus Schekmanbacteria bacterium]|nr:TIGR04255 family protein [Candidatus Schekmanbacteria bacterium]
MPEKILKNKPLVESILEIKWTLASPAPNILIDPHYKLLLGRLYERLSSNYPEHEQLPSAMIPDEMAAHIVQHRFRYSSGDWPLVQIGPGIITINDTHKYTWDDFRSRCIDIIHKLFSAHPKPSDLKIEGLFLRYIDAVEFDYESTDIYTFLREKMKVTLELPQNLFTNNIRKLPNLFSWQSAFSCANPKGMVTVCFATGHKEAKPALLWETMVHTTGANVPPLPEGFQKWIDSAHTITDDWFFKIIEGELERRFSGE